MYFPFSHEKLTQNIESNRTAIKNILIKCIIPCIFVGNPPYQTATISAIDMIKDNKLTLPWFIHFILYSGAATYTVYSAAKLLTLLGKNIRLKGLLQQQARVNASSESSMTPNTTEA